jgi:SAM-dependent methyltransferase
MSVNPYEALPKLGSAESFARLRQALLELDFTERSACARLNLEPPLELVRVIEKTPEVKDVTDGLGLALRLLLLGGAVPVPELEAHCGELLAALEELGLLGRDEADPGKVYCICALYPIEDLLVASDRWTTHDQSEFHQFPDIVYPALIANTRRFLDLLPVTVQGDFLELCGGAGAAALRAAGTAKTAWSTDILERATHFAEFNRRLNALENVVTATGDLYDAVGERQFDCIVAHPPYVPSLSQVRRYADGGPDGEQITRGIVAGLERHLRPGGRCYCLTLGTEREGEPFEQRVRGWLGAAAAEFDVAFYVCRFFEPTEFAREQAVRERGGSPMVKAWKTFFEKEHIQELIYGFLVLQRHAAPRRAFQVRRRFTEMPRREASEWSLALETAAAEPGYGARLLRARPVVSPHCELLVRHRVEEREFVPTRLTLSVNYPFAMDCETAPWAAMMLARCDGSLSCAELFEACRRDRILSEDVPLEDFLGFLHQMISGGFLQIAEFTPPTRPEQPGDP